MLVSIIVPFYNVEPYFRRCLNSIVNQSYRDLEIILVNDCSPDNSIAIAKEYASKDSRIKIIEHEINLRQGGARNSGLAMARGEYVWFIDSDDEINGYDAISLMVQKVTEHNYPDILYFSLYYINEKEEVIYKPLGLQEGSIYLESKQALENFVMYTLNHVVNTENFLNGFAHLKFYKRRLLLESRFSFPVNTHQSEDAISFFPIFLAKTHVILPNAINYRYYYVESSSSHKKICPKQRLDAMMLTLRRMHCYYLDNQSTIQSEVLDIFLIEWVREVLHHYHNRRIKELSLLLEINAIFKDMIWHPHKLAVKLRNKEVSKNFWQIERADEIALWLESLAYDHEENQSIALLTNIMKARYQESLLLQFIRKIIKMVLPYGIVRLMQKKTSH